METKATVLVWDQRPLKGILYDFKNSKTVETRASLKNFLQINSKWGPLETTLFAIFFFIYMVAMFLFLLVSFKYLKA